jgi:small subunit ribosomal protein S21|tara:strand:+ start:219 stop:428 length:210 start_codon:yes stop_codon:yes gene_type:complete
MSVNFTINLRDDNVEKAIKKMKTKMSKLGITKDLRENMFYEKPSDKKVRVRKDNIINSKKNKRMRERDL